MAAEATKHNPLFHYRPIQFPVVSGYPCGTGGCKSVAISAAGQVSGLGAGDYSGATAKAIWKEQDPQVLLTRLIRSVRATDPSQEEVAPGG